MWEMENATKWWLIILREEPLDLGVHSNIILKMISEK
jgi:hypothetical protein